VAEFGHRRLGDDLQTRDVLRPFTDRCGRVGDVLDVVGAVGAPREREAHQVAAVGVGEGEPAEFDAPNTALAVEFADERLPGERLARDVGNTWFAST